MDLYLGNQKFGHFVINPINTVKDVKDAIKASAQKQGVDKYTVRLVFSNNEQLSPVVFEGITYDSWDFQSKAKLLNGGYIQIIPKPQVSYNPLL